MAEIYLAGGCFWGLEKYIKMIRGVRSTLVGYANGRTENPSYEDVCYNNTGHAEAVKVEYNENVLPLKFLLRLYFEAIDPTSLNRQGWDIGVQYRTGIYYTDDADLQSISEAVERLQSGLDKPVAVEVAPLMNFFPAEEYHQNYLDRNPGGYCHIGIQKIKKAAEAIPEPSDFPSPEAELLKRVLTKLQFDVTQRNATEPPFENEYWDHFADGIYVDIITGEPLFSSRDKFLSSCGWPSFSKPLSPDALCEREDSSYSMIRTEVRSRKGDSHLGHVFEDGPLDRGGLRYCINSAALRFVPKEDMEKEGYGHLLDKV